MTCRNAALCFQPNAMHFLYRYKSSFLVTGLKAIDTVDQTRRSERSVGCEVEPYSWSRPGPGAAAGVISGVSKAMWSGEYDPRCTGGRSKGPKGCVFKNLSIPKLGLCCCCGCGCVFVNTLFASILTGSRRGFHNLMGSR